MALNGATATSGGYATPTLKSIFPPEIVRRADALLKSIGRKHQHLRMPSLEQVGDGWRLRVRRWVPEMGKYKRHSVKLPGDVAVSAAMAAYIRGRFVRVKGLCAASWSAQTQAEAGRRRCQAALSALRARVVAACSGGRRQKDELGRAFDLAAKAGAARLEEFLGLRLWERAMRPPRGLEELDALYERIMSERAAKAVEEREAAAWHSI